MSVATSTSAPLVTTDWTREHLDDPKVRFLEVDVDTDSYDTGHLPGRHRRQLEVAAHRPRSPRPREP